MVGKTIAGAVWGIAVVTTQLNLASSVDSARSLLDADRSFAAASASVNNRIYTAAALGPMFASSVIMPTTQGQFANGKAAVVAALQRQVGASYVVISWRPIRVGVSADGQHGFTFGYMTQTRRGLAPEHFKYMAYWIRGPQGWRVAVYKRGRSAGPPSDTVVMPSSLPPTSVTPTLNWATINAFRTDLITNEQRFSDEAQRFGMGHAFAQFGSNDAVNMGGADHTDFVVGASQIALAVSGGDMAATPYVWSADTAIVASSGDLGVTIGRIHAKDANGLASTAPGTAFPFFTIWHRNGTNGRWLYIAE